MDDIAIYLIVFLWAINLYRSRWAVTRERLELLELLARQAKRSVDAECRYQAVEEREMSARLQARLEDLCRAYRLRTSYAERFRALQ